MKNHKCSNELCHSIPVFFIYITCFIKHYCFVNFEIYLEFYFHIILKDKFTVDYIHVSVKFLFIIKYNILVSIQEINKI